MEMEMEQRLRVGASVAAEAVSGENRRGRSSMFRRYCDE